VPGRGFPRAAASPKRWCRRAGLPGELAGRLFRRGRVGPSSSGAGAIVEQFHFTLRSRPYVSEAPGTLRARQATGSSRCGGALGWSRRSAMLAPPPGVMSRPRAGSRLSLLSYAVAVPCWSCRHGYRWSGSGGRPGRLARPARLVLQAAIGGAAVCRSGRGAVMRCCRVAYGGVSRLGTTLGYADLRATALDGSSWVVAPLSGTGPGGVAAARQGSAWWGVLIASLPTMHVPGR